MGHNSLRNVSHSTIAYWTIPQRTLWYNSGLECEWDETKRRSNFDKHELDFTTTEEFEWDSSLIIHDNRHREARWIAYGNTNGRLHAVVYARRAGGRRIISLRKAHWREERRYAHDR